jgi:hypothetical protein
MTASLLRMLRDLVLSAASEENGHNPFSESTSGLGARRIAEDSFVFAESHHPYSSAVYSGVLRRREEELHELLDANQNSIDQTSKTYCLVSHRLLSWTDQILQGPQVFLTGCEIRPSRIASKGHRGPASFAR